MEWTISADILAGYATDLWFAEDASLAKEDLRLETVHTLMALHLLCRTLLLWGQASCSSCMTQTMLVM